MAMEPPRQSIPEESGFSALSWTAIFGGALAAAATSLILLAVGSGLGLAAVSPWRNVGISAATFGVSAAIWMVVVQWLSSAFGGYMAGRLRTRWVGIHSHEVTFRDSAHGILAWALSSVIAATLVGATAVGALSGAARMAPDVMSLGDSAAAGSGPVAYANDVLFRADHPVSIAPETRVEAGRLVGASFGKDGLSDTDKAYLVQIVVTSTGLTPADAGKRVDDVLVEAKLQADAARKAASFGAFMTALSLLIGAFIGGAAGALGGLRRDHYATLLHS